MAALGARLVAAIERPIEIDERCVYVGASGGAAATRGGPWSADGLLEDADLALYRAKADGGCSMRVFAPEMRAVAQTRISISSGLREAWERQEFVLHFQPQVRLDDRRVTGAEALIRWSHPERAWWGPAPSCRCWRRAFWRSPSRPGCSARPAGRPAGAGAWACRASAWP
jgi:predicted signal transduction protein with EAL and GGDEF domain